MSRAEKILEMKHVHARYGPVPALNDVSLHVKKDEIVTLLGSNGAGKTTTLNSIYGILPVLKGDIRFFRKDIRGSSPQRLVGLGICYVPEGGKVFDPMTVWDNLVLGSYSRRGKGKKDEMERNVHTIFELFPILQISRKRLAGTLSGGERRMLTIGRALMSSPRLLLLDEPSLGLAPALVSELMRVVKELRNGGLSVLLVEQNARAALRISDRGYVMDGGSITISGSAHQLLSDESVRTAYLGGRGKGQ